jgi:hypothetical protein
VVHQDEHVIAFMDIQPVTEGHVVVVPRVHGALLEDIDEVLGAKVWRTGHRVARALRRSEVPSIFDAEVLSALRGLVRGGKFDRDAAQELVADLMVLPVERWHMSPLLPRMWELRENLTRNPSANRDEDVLTDPDRFDIRRNSNRHLALGADEHSCLGSTLARAELRLLCTELLEQAEAVELDGAPVRLGSIRGERPGVAPGQVRSPTGKTCTTKPASPKRPI